MKLGKLNILYAHYKETYKIIVSRNTLRDKLFVYLLIALTFDTHKDIIRRIDSLVETVRSVNHNEELFTEAYYEKRVGFGENYRGVKKVTISASGSKGLKELKDKRADLKIT